MDEGPGFSMKGSSPADLCCMIKRLFLIVMASRHEAMASEGLAGFFNSGRTNNMFHDAHYMQQRSAFKNVSGDCGFAGVLVGDSKIRIPAC